jgi:hypothetical protein
MWGTSSHGDELTGNLANELDAISIDDRGLLRLFAEKSSRVDLGLLQHNRHEGDLPRCLLSGRYRVVSGRKADMAESSQMTPSGHTPEKIPHCG